jgi:hypothetical protein
MRIPPLLTTSIKLGGLIVNTLVRRNTKQSSAYLYFEIDPKRLRCECGFEEVRDSEEKLAEVEKIWM